jgi:hypothetical protein
MALIHVNWNSGLGTSLWYGARALFTFRNRDEKLYKIAGDFVNNVVKSNVSNARKLGSLGWIDFFSETFSKKVVKKLRSDRPEEQPKILREENWTAPDILENHIMNIQKHFAKKTS